MTRHRKDPAPEARLLQGTLDMLILKIVALEPMHGYGIVQRIQQMSNDSLQVRQGSLYPALYRMEKRRLLNAEWKTNESGHEAKYYKITRQGRQVLASETESWERPVDAIGHILRGEAQS
jgi:transcriptional regulator